jgi:hypothetical protein
MTLDSPTFRVLKNVTETLSRCWKLVEPVLRDTVGQLRPWTSRMTLFTFGWVESDGTPRDAQGAKGFARPSRCSARRGPVARG